MRCALPTCADGATPFIPQGQCCPVCPPGEASYSIVLPPDQGSLCGCTPQPAVVCSAPIYPPDFIPACLVVVRRWTFQAERGSCSEIPYSSCGQGEGFNVFADQLTCESMCNGRSKYGGCGRALVLNIEQRYTVLHSNDFAGCKQSCVHSQQREDCQIRN